MKHVIARIILAVSMLTSLAAASAPGDQTEANQPAAVGTGKVYIPIVMNRSVSAASGLDWPQLAHDPQRTNATPEQVDPPYCYAWKWNAVPIASQAQPVVMNGMLYIGGMDGRLYARDATTGAGIWNFTTGGPIRHSAAASGSLVITGSYDGYTYALGALSGDLIWETFTGSSATAPLIDEAQQRVYVASTDGKLTALDLNTGDRLWTYDSGYAILTSPALSADGSTVYFGNEAVKAIALDAATGGLRWQASLQGQSLAGRHPVVSGSVVMYRSQPYYFFHHLLQGWGDDVMDQAGAVNSSWSADWANVRPKITSFLNANPSMQTFFALNASNGASLGTVPVLWTYGSNEIPNSPVVSSGGVFVTYRARHGIQTDSKTVHVSTKYDAELGQLNLGNLDITGLTASSPLAIPNWGGPSFRMTSDEAGDLTMGGNILWIDNWERLGGINVQNGQIVHAGNVSNDWPACGAQCGTAGPHPFFPLSGKSTDPAYPFPGPQTTESGPRSGAVIANGMVFWKATASGLGAFKHSASSSCSSPAVWTDSGGPIPMTTDIPAVEPQPAAPALSTYVTTDLTAPAAITAQNQDLVNRLNDEVARMLQAANGGHLMPYYIERGFSSPRVWPYNSTQSGLPEISVTSHGNSFWHDPGELLYSMALAYPYLNSALQAQVKSYMQAEMNRFPPMQNLPYSSTPTANDWMRAGSAREPYPLAIRQNMNNWPPVAANLSAIYALWLWSKNTNDWSYATQNWSQVQSLFNARSPVANMKYYADIAGAIGYYRLATRLGKTTEAQRGMDAAVAAMQAGLNFAAYRDRAKADYLDPRDQATGWSAPVFFGLTPEVGLYLREQLGGQASAYLVGLESLDSGGNGLLWWYLTRAGEHAEVGETSFLLPHTAWSHFLGHAYIIGDGQANLRKWLDRPWVPGDLYSLQKIVATIQAPP